MGHRFANGVDVALSGTYEHSDGVGRLYFPAFDTPATNNGVAEGLDGEGVRQFYGRLAFKGLTVTGAYGSRRRDVPTASFGTLFNEQDSREQTTDRHTLVDAEYGRSFGGTRVTFRASFDRFSYDGTYPFAGEPDGAPTLVGRNSAVGTRWSVGSGLTRAFRGRQTVRAGVEFIDNVHQDQTARYVDPPVLVLDSHRSSTQHAVYVQDEIKLARWLIVNAGLRYDGYEEFRAGHAPRGADRPALVDAIGEVPVRQRISSAERIRAERPFYFGERVNNLRPESIDTHELVWERYVNDWLRTSVSTYWYKADRLITLVPDDSTFLGVSFVNQGEVRAKGLELEAQMRLKGESRALVSYALQSAVDQETHRRAPEFAATHRQGANQPARADGSVVRVRGGTVSQQPRARLPARRCRRRRPSTSPWSSRSDAPGSSSAACEISSTPSIRTPFRVSTGRTPSPRTAERLGSDSAGGCGLRGANLQRPGREGVASRGPRAYRRTGRDARAVG